MKVARSFTGRWTSLFATTYSVELEFFDEYLFRRLGEPPLSATVLVDAGTHARLWTSGGDPQRRLRRANRDYLLRPVLFGTGAFHPKTFLLGNANEGVLLVGSGNLTVGGVERGREVFTQFRSSEPDDLPSIRAWRQWMDGIVERLGDDEVNYRWLRLRKECGWLEGDAAGSLFIGSGTRSILDQFADGVEGEVAELHVMAPFYDRDALALAALLDRFRPQELHLYFGKNTSVHGPALAQVASGTGSKLSLREIEPLEFVHAKLIGVVAGDACPLLFGSANLSRAALLGTVEPWANVEAAVAVTLSPDELRDAFVPPSGAWRDVSLERLSELEFAAEERPVGFPAHLRAAWPENDGRVTIDVGGDLPPPGAELTAGAEAQRLDGITTVAPLALPAEAGVLVWLQGAAGDELSNRVPLDDRRRLGSWLQERADAGARPGGLDSADFETPVGRMLLRLHETCIFDIDETPALARASGLTDQEAEEQTASWEELEELLAKEELARDPRVEHYRRGFGYGLADEDDVLGLLRLMLDRAPAERTLHLVGGPEPEPPNPDPQPGKRWTPTQRLRVRLFNVLQRWSLALADARFIWIDPTAPVRNYSALLVAIAECSEQEHLPEDRIVRVLGTLLGSFIRTERSRGYLGGVSAEERQRALERLPDEARTLAAALVYCALRPNAKWRDYLFDWQPALVEGLAEGAFVVSKRTCDLAERLSEKRPTEAQVRERLQWAAEYIDDEHWAERQQRDLALEQVRLTQRGFKHGFAIEVGGEGARLANPHLVSLVRQALAYRKSDGAVVELADGTRLSVNLDRPVWAKDGDAVSCTAQAVDLAALAELERQGISFAQVLAPAQQIAS